MDKCTQCNYCSLICPHAAVRPFLSTAKDLEKAPEGFKKGSRKAIGGGALDNYNFRVQVMLARSCSFSMFVPPPLPRHPATPGPFC